LRCERGSVDVVCPPLLPSVDDEEDRVRAVALDVHRDFCEVAIVEEGRLHSAGRIKTRPEAVVSAPRFVISIWLYRLRHGVGSRVGLERPSRGACGSAGRRDERPGWEADVERTGAELT
jgi:hypothetical protein